MLNREEMELRVYPGYARENSTRVPKELDRKILLDATIIGGLFLGTEAISPTIFTVLLFLYMSYKILASPYVYTFPYLLLLIPNLGAAIIPGVPAPLLNLLVPIAIVKLILAQQTKKLDVALLAVTLLLLLYEFSHIYLYGLRNMLTLASWVLVILFVILSVSDDEHAYNHEMSIKYFLAGVVISTVIGLYRNVTLMGTLINFNQTNVTVRFAGAAGDPNYFSLYVLVGLLSLISLLDKSKSFLSKAAYVGFFIALPLIASMALSRMYLIVLAVTGALYILKVFSSWREYHIHKKAIAVIFAIGVAAFYSFPNIMNNFTLVLERFTMYKGDVSLITSNRNLIASDILTALVENPVYLLFGVGIQNYGHRIGHGGGYAHNILLELFASGGIFGTLLFLLFIATLIYKVKEKSRSGLQGKFKLIRALPLLAIAISYMALNAIEVESFYILLLFSIKNMWYPGVEDI